MPPPSAMAGRLAARRGAKKGLEGGEGPHVRGEAPSRKTRRPRRVFGVRGCLWLGKMRTWSETDASPSAHGRGAPGRGHECPKVCLEGAAGPLGKGEVRLSVNLAACGERVE